MTQAEYEALVLKLGSVKANRCIEMLNDAKEAKGYRYVSDAAAMRTWVIKQLQDDISKGRWKPPTVPGPGDEDEVDLDKVF
jgi:hypothetical protein